MIKSKDKKIHVPYTHLYVYTQLGVCMCSDAISEQRQELGMEHIYDGMDPSRRQHVGRSKYTGVPDLLARDNLADHASSSRARS